MIDVELVDTELEIILSTKIIEALIERVVTGENKELGVLTVVFGADEWLLSYNIDYLNHDYFTDIITFDYSEKSVVSGDLLISLERVYDNSATHNVSRETELSRVIIHGVLHLCGYDDKSEKDIRMMRKKEDYYLSLL